MYRNILIPVVFDDDGNTSAAFEAAQALADTDARITLMHVIETVPVYVSEYISADILNNTRDLIQKKLTDLAKQLPGCHIALSDGRPGPRISRWAEENGTDCIVIASHKPGFGDFLLGSTAARVVRHAQCCVHVLR